MLCVPITCSIKEEGEEKEKTWATPSLNLLKCHVHIHITHIVYCHFRWHFQADFFNFSCTFDYKSKHIIYFSFANEKRNSKANKLSKPGSERRNERLSEGASEKHIQPLTIFHRICENRSNRNFSSVHNFYVFSVISLNQTDSVRFDLIQLDSIEGSDIRKCIHRTHTHPHTHGAGF